MEKNLKELVDKIYSDGVSKAEEEKDQIISSAKKEAESITREARHQAEKIIREAEEQAREISENNASEMRLAARQAVSSLKQEIVDLLVVKVTAEPLEEAFSDPDFIKRIIEKMIDFWLDHYGKEHNLQVLLPKKDLVRLRQYFTAKSQELLQKGVVVKPTGNLKNGFQIGPEDEVFKIRFTSDEFENYFKTYIRPRAFEVLYGKDKK